MAATQHLPLRRSVPRALPHYMGFAHTQRDEDGDEVGGDDGDGDTRREDFKDAAIQVRSPCNLAVSCAIVRLVPRAKLS